MNANYVNWNSNLDCTGDDGIIDISSRWSGGSSIMKLELQILQQIIATKAMIEAITGNDLG